LGFAVNNYPNVLEFLPQSGLNSEGFLTELKSTNYGTKAEQSCWAGRNFEIGKSDVVDGTHFELVTSTVCSYDYNLYTAQQPCLWLHGNARVCPCAVLWRSSGELDNEDLSWYTSAIGWYKTVWILFIQVIPILYIYITYIDISLDMFICLLNHNTSWIHFYWYK
jgi:hypothetical protein